uniref:Uncharacterized protein n=1 Tax=Myripristis murdjan TaxID=586833 RepID=A0A667XSR0_9TELE
VGLKQMCLRSLSSSRDEASSLNDSRLESPGLSLKPIFPGGSFFRAVWEPEGADGRRQREDNEKRQP